MQTRFMSYVVIAPGEVVFEEHLLILGRGHNVFTISLSDPAEFRKRLLAEDCNILQENFLDNLEALPSEVVEESLPELAQMRKHPLLKARE